MMRLPQFDYRAPRSLDEAAAILADHAPGEAMLMSGGTDLLPKMKRRQQVPTTVIGLRGIVTLVETDSSSTNRRGDTTVTLGAGLTLTHLVRDTALRESYRGLWQAAAQVATPHLRNMGTLGGNICLDTRCNYYDQNQEWRQAIGFCMKKDGDICWVAPGSSRCLAISSTDTAPALMALGAHVRLTSKQGEREVAMADLYAQDGIDYLTRRPGEILTHVVLPARKRWRSTYWKLRRRGAFDFPVVSVAVAIHFSKKGIVEEARLVLGAIASRPMEASAAATSLTGRTLDDDAIEAAAILAARVAKPMDNTDFGLHWRKRVVGNLVRHALCELRGDDMRAARQRLARWSMDTPV